MFSAQQITSAGELDDINTVEQLTHGGETLPPLSPLILDSDRPRVRYKKTVKVLRQVNLTEAQGKSGACEASIVETTADEQLAAAHGNNMKRKTKLIVAPETHNNLVKTCIEIQS